MRRLFALLCGLFSVIGVARTSQAFYLDFEWALGRNYEWIASDVPGLEFASDMFYADATSGAWNVSSYDLGLQWNAGYYWIEGYVAAHASANGIGRINFNSQDASWFTTGYSSGSTFYLEAYDAHDNLLDVASGPANRRYLEGNEAGLGYLTVSSASNDIAYVVMHDGGYYWLADNMSGDASGVGVPEPATIFLFGAGSLCLAGFRRRLRKR